MAKQIEIVRKAFENERSEADRGQFHVWRIQLLPSTKKQLEKEYPGWTFENKRTFSSIDRGEIHESVSAHFNERTAPKPRNEKENPSCNIL